MDYDAPNDKHFKSLDVSSDASNMSFLISPQSQKVLRMATFDIQGIYEHIARKDRRERLRNITKPSAGLKQGRYHVIKIIGKGSFGSVIEASDSHTSSKVAIKIIKLRTGISIHSNNEVINLKKIRQTDPENSHFVSILDHFEEQGYLCIVLELLHKTLYQFLSEVKCTMNLQETSVYAHQLFKSLQLLHSMNIIHCDLKPENIMFRAGTQKVLKLVDFGSSCEAGKNVYKFVQSRFYRSPEVALRLDYALPIDIWSAGCVLAELYTGKPLFKCETETALMVGNI